MSLYTVTIVPSDISGASAGTTQAVVRVDTGPPKPRVIEMTLQSSAPSGLTSASLPIIDLNGVVEALHSGIVPGEASHSSIAPSIAPLVDRRDGGERVYRRMPDAEELGAAYERIGTVTGVAKHYGVPRHTAQGWMKRLRKLDTTANVSAKED